MATHLRPDASNADALDGMSLPGWLYYDPEFFEAEKRAFLRSSPQVVCHESEIAEAGNWRSLDYLGESVIVIRDDDGEVRAFSNVCRHRGSRLVEGTGGCAKVLTCPYHAWSYGRDGWLVGVPHRQEYPGLETEQARSAPVNARELARLPVRDSRVRRLVGCRDDGTLRGRGCSVSIRGTAGHGPGHAPRASAQLEDGRRQLFGPSPHSGRPSRPYPAVRAQLPDRGARSRRPNGRRSGREGVGKPVGERLPATAPGGRPPSLNASAQVALLQTVSERSLRHLPGPGRFHAVPAGQRDPDGDPRD